MVDPVFTYVGGIAFLVLIIGSMLYLMYNYEGVDAEDTPNESVVRGAGPVAAEAAESDDEAVEGGADDPTEAVEAGAPADADEPSEDAADDQDAGEAEADEV